MRTGFPLLPTLDLVGTFAFAVNGALTALRNTRSDIGDQVTLGQVLFVDEATDAEGAA